MQRCRTCGIEFGQAGQGQWRYCKEHRLERAEAKARDQRNLRVRRREARSPATCAICGKSFMAKRSDAKTCSDECRRLDLNRRGRESEQRHRGRCISCGAEITRRSKRCVACNGPVGGDSRRAERSCNWKGGRALSKGYVYLLVAPSERKGHRYRAEHIVVWERANGKTLPKGWAVHHLNGIKDDNRPENLLATTRQEHSVKYHHGGGDEAFRPYERRIRELEAEVASLREQLTNGNPRPQI